MHLAAIYVRAFGPFNYDYRSQFEASSPGSRAPWDVAEDEEERPHVMVLFDPSMTALVGANESGKSQLLEALRQVRHPDLMKRKSVCRYSLEAGSSPSEYGHPSIGMRWAIGEDELAAIMTELQSEAEEEPPDPDAEASDTTPQDVSQKEQDVSEQSAIQADSVVIFRRSRTPYAGYHIYLLEDDECSYEAELPPDKAKQVLTLFPQINSLSTEEEFPVTVDIRSLLRCGGLVEQNDEWVGEGKVFEDPDVWQQHASTAQDLLVYKLVTQLCGYSDRDILELLLEDEEMKAKFGDELSRKINEAIPLTQLWHQDPDVKLVADVQQSDIRFLVEDKTSEHYSLPERSRGLKYFLAFLIHTLSATRGGDGSRVLLFDEPDYALSVVGQRDILSVFRRTAEGELGDGTHQLVYTTHSPYLIDRNFPSRVVGLHKGPYDEGALVIHRGHERLYEPIRTALGVPRTHSLLLDVPNILVEGISDVEYIVGFARYLAHQDEPHLNLNSVELVSADGASNMVRLLQTAMTHPQAQPYVTVLLDNDGPAIQARHNIEETPNLEHISENGQLLDVHSVLEERRGDEVTIEDLIPVNIYREVFIRAHEPQWSSWRSYLDEHMEAVWPSHTTIAEAFGSLVKEAKEKEDTPHLVYDKAAVARELSDYLLSNEFEQQAQRDVMLENLRKLNRLLSHAVRANRDRMMFENAHKSIHRQVRDFLRLHVASPAKATAVRLLERLASLARGIGGQEAFTEEVTAIMEAYELQDVESSDSITQYQDFRERLKHLPGRFQATVA